MKRIILVLTVLVALIFATTNIFAQFDIKGKVERKTNEKIDQKIDETLDEGLNGIFNPKENYENEESEETTSRALVVNIHNYGYIGADPDSLARTLVPAIRKAERDGV